MGRACCDPKRGMGKCMVFFFTIVFGLGVVISTSAPNWIGFVSTVPETNPVEKTYVNWGPFYGQYKTCTESPDGQSQTCSKWKQRSFDLSDCDTIGDNKGDNIKKLCGQLGTWRSMAIICLILVLIGGGLVFMASCCQMVTCGCCGNSLTCISNVIFWIEVVLSIVAWSFTISSLKLIATAPSVTHTEYQWGFWLFLFSGTVFGAMAAWMADLAAEDSCLRGAFHCLTCCFRGDDDDDDDKRKPLVGDDSA